MERKVYIFLLSIFFVVRLLGQTTKEELEKIVESYKLPNEFRWYSPEKEYIQIRTNSDRIYILPASKIIETKKEFEGKNIKYFHLLHKGEEVPCFFISIDDYLDNLDTLLFIGSRPRGDTTWFDSFEHFESFYLFYDDGFLGKRFEPFTFSSFNQNAINFIPKLQHFEVHKEYSIGFPEFSSQTVNGEGWVWALLSPSDDYIKQNRFSLEKEFFPSLTLDSVSFRIFAFSSKYDSIKTKHNFAVLINGDTAFKGIFPAGKNILFDFQYPTVKLYLGSNTFEVVNLGNYSSSGELIIPDVIGFQYFEYLSNEIPVAWNGFNSFPILENFEGKTLTVHNFESPNIFVFDTLNQKVSRAVGFSSVTFVASASKQKVFVSFSDSIYKDNRNGLHCFIYDSLKGEIKYLFYSDNSKKIVSELKNLSANSIYLVLFNGERIDNEVVDFFTAEGSRQVGKTKLNYLWAFAKKKNAETLFENSDQQNIVKLWGFFDANYSKKYSLTLNFDTNIKNGFLYLSDLKSIPEPLVNEVDISNLFDDTNQATVILITPKIFSDVGKRYVEYRRRTNPEHKIAIVSVEDIYKEFNFGKKSPDAIKRFLVWVYNKWKKPRLQYVVLLGDANFDTRNVLSNSIYEDFVPAFGWPPTDYWYCLLDGKDFVPDIHIGRIPIKSVEEGFAYIEKIIEYDNSSNAPWMKKFLFLSGGTNSLERDYFYDRLKGEFSDYILANSPLCVQTQVIRKSDEVVGSEADASFIRSAINDGISLMFFAGHGSAKVFDTDGWKVQTLNNKGKYGFFGSFSCNTANFAEPTLVSRNEEYTLFSNKGFIGTIGSGGVSIRLYSLLLAQNLLTIIADSTVKTDKFVELFDLARARQIAYDTDFYNVLTLYHYVYLGDPLLKMKIKRQPDLYFVENKISITNELNKPTFVQNDSLFIIRGIIGNAGFSKRLDYNLVLLHYFNGISDTLDFLKLTFNQNCSLQEFEFRIPVRQQIGLHRFQLIIDPEKRLNDIDYSNNSLVTETYVYSSSLFPVEPQANWDVNSSNPYFRFIDPYFEKGKQSYKFSIYSAPDTNSILIYSSNEEEIQGSKIKIDWFPRTTFRQGHFWLYVRKISSDTNFQNQTLWLPFHFVTENPSSSVLILINKELEYNDFQFQNIVFDTSVESLRLKPIRIPYRIMSASGNIHSERGKEITVNNKVYVTMAPDLDIVGFHAVVISHKDFSLKSYKIFETWGIDPPEKDSSSIKLVQFLRDSVPDGDYIFLLTHSSALRVPIFHKWKVPNSPGSLDTLQQALREWGCKYADSLGSDLNYWGNSFFFVGRNFFGHKITLDEGFDLDGDTVQSEGFLVQTPQMAKIRSKVFGPAKKWTSLSFQTILPVDSILLSTNVWGMSSPNDFNKQLLIRNSSLTEIDLSSINPIEFPYLYFEVEISNPYENYDFSFNNVQLKYRPTPELAIEVIEPQVRSDTSILRGEEMDYLLRTYNLSFRSSNDSTYVFVNLKTASQEQKLQEFLLGKLEPNSFKEVSGNLVTDKFDNYNIIEFSSRQKYSEFYFFNNWAELSLKLFEDTIPPEIVLYLDGRRVQRKEYVSKTPNVLIEIYDNSKLPVDSNATILLINTRREKLNERAKFTSYGKDVPLKCSFMLDSVELEYGINYFTIYTSDATGNKDTLDVPVYVYRTAKIDSFKVAPHPVTSEATFFINYLSSKKDGVAYINIFDITGRKIRTLSKPIQLNQNEIYWDCRDEYGKSIPQGVYFFSINVVGEIYSEPVFGKLIKVE